MLRSTFGKLALVSLLSIFLFNAQAQNQALDLSGTGNEVNVPSYQLTTGPGFTVEQWINIPVITQSTILVNQSNSNFPAPMDAYVNTDGSVTFLLGNGTATFTSATTAPGVITAGTWHHVAIVYDPASVGTEGQIFIDGNITPAATATNPAAIGNLGPIRIGRRADLAEGDDIYVDEVRIWSIARDGAAINGDYDQELLGNEAGLDIYLRFEGNLTDGAVLNGLQNGGMVAGTDAYITGAPIIENNYALNFDGVDEYVNLGTDIRDQLTGLSNVTVEGWVYRTADKSFHTIFGNYGSDLQTLLRIDGTPAANLAFWVNNGSGFISATGSTTIPINTWTHVAGTWNGNTIRVYINGVEDGSATHNGSLGGNGNNYHVGGDPTAPPGEFMQGQIDEIRVWNTTRTASQLLAFKDVELNGPEPGLVAYYDFEEGSSSTLLLDKENDVPNINGSLTNMEENADWVVATHGVAPAGPLDTTNPDVTISSTELDPTAANPIPITITFTEEVAGFELSDIFVTNGSAGNLNTADNTVFTADITPSASGIVSVDVFPGVTTDLTGNGNNTATQFSITSDAEPPVIIATTLSAARNRIYVEFDEAVFGAADGSTPVDAGDFTVNTVGGTASVIVNSLNVLSPRDIEFDITISGVPDGSEVVDVTPNVSAVYDAGGNIMSVSQISNLTGLVDQSALSFDGGDDFVRVAADPAFSNQQYTLEAWINIPEQPVGSDTYTIISKGTLISDGGLDRNGYTLLYGDMGGGMAIILGQHTAADATEVAQYPITLLTNTWYHVAATYDGTAMRVFFNGAEVGINSSLSNNFVDHTGDNQDIKIGAMEGNASTLNFHRGLIDEVRVWNYARTDAQISALMDEEISGAQNGLVAYYDFNDGIGTTLTDIAAGRNGTLDPAMNLAGATGNWVSGGTILAPADATAPTITFGQNLQTIGTTIIGGTHDDNLAAIEVSLDGGTTRTLAINNGDGTWNYDMAGDPNYGGDAPYSLNFYIIDEAENEGTAVGNVTIDLQNSLNFDGLDDYAEAPDAASLDITGALTLEAWVFFNTPIDEETPLITKWNPDAAPEQRSYLFQLDNTSQVTFAVSTDGTTAAQGTNFSALQVPFTFQTGRWYHLAATYQPSAFLRVYVNGELIGENATSIMPSIFNSNASLVLGANGNTLEVGVGGVNTGEAMQMDEVRVWSVAKTQADIQADITSELTGSELNLEAYYDFNLASGTTITDRTANANNATLNDNNNGVADGVIAGPYWGGSTVFDNDVLAPFFVSGFPLIDNITGTGFDITVQLNEEGQYFYVIVPDGATTPTVDDVRSGTGFGGTGQVDAGNIAVLAATTNYVLSPATLSNATDYDVYIVAQDDEGSPNVQSQLSLFNVTTLAGSQVFNVTNLNDAGPGSLRQAIIDANGAGGATPGDQHIIGFTLPGQVTLLDALPAISNHIRFQGDISGTTIHRDGAQEDFRIFDIGAFTVDIEDIIIDNGRMATTNDDGGGIYANGTTLTMFNSVVQNCTAERFGGGIYTIGNAVVRLERVTLFNNQNLNAGGWGGGIGVNTGSLEMVNCTVHGNASGGNGGGIFVWDGVTFTLTNSTVVNNNAGNNGGGVVDQSSTCNYVFTNNIIANNTASASGNDIFITSALFGTNTANIVEDCTGTGCPAFFSSADPALAVAQTCGIQTYFPLNVGSAAIESGTTTGAPSDDICENAYSSVPNIGSNNLVPTAAPGGIGLSLSLWLKADLGVTGTTQVSQWDDQSVGALNATQATGANQPALTDVAINYNPAISFDGSDDYFTVPFDITPLATPDLTTIIVFNSNTAATSTFRKLFGHDAGSFQRSVGIDSRSGTNVGYFTGSGVANYFNLVANQNYISTTEYTSSTFSGYIDGFQVVNGAPVSNSGGNATLSIGAINLAGAEQWNGQIAEMIMYSGTLSVPERNRIDTYLAIKYGISIDQTSATNYVATDDNPVWDGTANAAYNQHIAGIGRDDASELNQKQSISSDGRLSMGLGGIAASNQANANSFTNDRAYLVWGDNGLDMAFAARDIANVPSGIDSRPQRIWKASEANSDVGNVTLRFDLNGEGYPGTYNPGNFKLMLDTDADFSTGAIELTADSYAGGIVEFNNVNIANGQFFTLGINEPPLPATNFVVYNSSATEITFEWTDNAFNETGYQILEANNYSFASGIATVVNIPANSTSYTHTPAADKFYMVIPTNGFEDPTSQSSVEFATIDDFPGQALDFNGTGQYVSVADNDAMSFGNGATDSPMSVEAWIYLDQVTSRSIVSKRSGENEWHLVISSDGRVSVTLADQSSSGFLFGESPVIGFNTGEWYHVAFTYDGSSLATGINTYVNGVLQAQTPGSSGSYTAMENTNSPVEIGSLNSGASFNFDGRIDELKIWDFVKIDYSDRNAQLDLSNASYPAGLVAYYPLDEGVGSTTVDRSRNTNDGTLISAPTFVPSTASLPTPPAAPTNVIAYASSATAITIEWTDNATTETGYNVERDTDPGFGAPTIVLNGAPANTQSFVDNPGADARVYYRVQPINGGEDGSSYSEVEFASTFAFPGQALSFDGSVDYISLNTPESYSNITIEAWVNTSGGTDQTIYSSYDGTNGFQFAINSTNQLTFSIGDGMFPETVNSTEAISTSQWTHIAVSYNGSTATFYENGTALTTSGSLSLIPNDAGIAEYIGRTNSGTNFFSGELDELKIWDIAKPNFSDRFGAVQGNEGGLVLYYAFDENSGIEVFDRSATNHNGTITGAGSFVTSTVPLPAPGEVYNTSDSGVGSLRDAITYANANPGTTITFNIPGGGPYNIGLATALPDITAAGTIIDGTTQPGWTFGDANNMVTLDGSLLGTNVSGLVINDVPNCAIYGLVVTGFTSISESVASIEINGDNADNAIIGAANMGNIIHGMVSAGISFQDADFLTIQGNRFGTFDGSTRSEINKHVIYGSGTTDNVIIGGDSDAGEGNLISGAGNGRFGLRLNIQGSVFIRGNYIGTNSNGDASIFNEGGGIYLSGSHTGEIGGTGLGQGNVISGNTTGYGIRLGGSVAVINNIIGLDRTGTNPVSNGGDGIIIAGTGGVVVDGNIISSNGGDAITSLTGFGNADIINNIIGFNQTLTIARPNAAGIVIDNGPGTDNRFGYKDNPNVIANNTGAAIYLTSTSTGNTFATNQIYNNGSGIDLEAGANGSVAPPTIDNVTATDASGTGVDGTTIHLYLGDGAGQGETFLDSTTVSGGLWSIPGLSLLTSDQVVATATDPGAGIGTSTFSAAASIPVQNSLAFDGTDDHGSIGTNVFGGPYTGPFTIEAWVNSSLTGNNIGSIGSGIFKNMESGSGAIGDLALTINNVGQIGLLNWREAATDADGYTVSDASIPADTWTHVAASWDGSVNRIFINGVEQTFTTASTSSGWGAGFEIGRSNSATQWHYDGVMDELRVWNVARSSVDITNNLFNELDPGTEVNLVAYYQFNQSSGVTIPDAKGSFDATWNGPIGTNTTPAWATSTALMNPASVVTTTNDTGAGSLREAIVYANANPGTTITFNIGEAAPWVINLATALPQVTAANTVIDGVSQPGWTFGDPNAMVQINGSGIGGNANGINIDAIGAEVNGLILTGFAGNISNGAIYLASDAADNATIGGSNKGNIIHGTTGGNAIYIVNADNATIQGNRIGTLDGTTLSAIGDHGIATTGEVTTLTIGGDFFTGEGNLISGAPAFRYGMNLFGSGGTGLSNVTISGNKIGTNEAADGAIPNTLGGINILGTNSAITIGGPSPSDLNIISGNGDHGIIIQVGNGFDIDGNYIGLQSDGSSALGNGGSGIRINGTASNINIGTNSLNFISENVEYGIVYDGNSSSNTALGTNVFSCNQLGGIGYGSGPLTPGGTIDNISLTSATISTAAADGSIAFIYLADDGCNNDQGVAFAGSATVTSGQAVISGGFAPGSHYVALIEDVNGFSTFSSPVVANFAIVSNTNDSGADSFREAINYANANPGATIFFNLPGSGPWEITLASALPNITAAGTIIDATTQPFWDLSTANVPNIIGNAGINIGLNFVSVNNVEVYGIRLSEFNIDGIRYNVVGSAPNGYTFGGVGKGNIFTGNQNGIDILTYTGGGTIQGSYFGILPDGNTAGVSNGTGILLGTNADNVQIGGTGAGEGNVISNNTNDGIRISNADFTTIQGNNIGLDPTETMAHGSTNGIDLTAATNALIEQNVISGHNVGIRFNNSSTNTVIANNIGVASDGSTPFGNTDGISIIDNLDSDNNVIGDAALTSNGNIIANSINIGIHIDGAGNNGNLMYRNQIFNNSTTGVSFTGGAQNGISPPAIDPIVSANTVTGTGTNGEQIDLYTSDGTGQGDSWLGATTVTGGVWSIGSLALNGGDEVVATTTNFLDGTSEFSTSVTFSGTPYPELEGAGEALTFDGTDDFVQIPSGAPSSFTAEAWVKFATTTDQTVLKYTNSGNPVANISRQLRLNGGVFQHNTFDGSSVTVIGTTPVVAGEWYHVAITGEDAGVVRLYVNGVEEGTAQPVGTQDVSGNEFRLGQISTGDANFFNGEIDEVRIWDFVMPESSLREYLARKVTNAHPSFANLIAYYRMDDTGDAVNLLDFSGANNTTISGATYTATGSGAHLGDLSIYEYVYTAGSGRNLNDFSTQNLGTANLPLHIYQVNQTPTNNGASGFNTIDDALYYGVFSPGQTYQARFAVVGVSPDRRILSRDDLTDLTWETASGFLGTEVQDDQIISPVRLGSGQYVTATQSAPYPSEIDGGSALSFDGVNDFVDLGGNPAFAGHQNLTLEAWINPDYTNVSDHGAILSNLAPSVGGGGYQLSISNANVRVLYRDNTFTDRELISGPLPEGEWSHLVGIVENAGANSNLYLYVNGIQVASALGVTGVPDYTGITNMFIGSNSDGVAGAMPLDREFGGQLDEVRIWSTVLTETEIRDHMIGRIDPDIVAFANLMAAYKFDDSDPNTAYDVAGFSDGAITEAVKAISSAPQGQGSIYSYNAGPAKLSTAAFNEDIILNIDDASLGVHGYLIAGPPDQTAADGFNALDQTKYYGLWAPGNPKVDIRMDYNNGGSPDIQRRIVYRTDATDNAASGGWERVSGLINSDQLTDSVYAYNVAPGEFTTATLNPPSSYPILGATDPGSALSFDGFDDHVTVPGIETAFDAAQGFTLEAWITPANLNGTLQHIMGINNSYRLLVDTNDQLLLGTSDGATPTSVTNVTAALANGTPTHIAATLTAGGDAELFINGSSVHTQSGVSIPQSPVSSFYIGGLDIGEYFFGEIDEVRVWSSVVAVGDIMAFANTTDISTHPNYADMVAYYKFDEGSGSILEDVFANNNGTWNGPSGANIVPNWVPSGALANAPEQNALNFNGAEYIDFVRQSFPSGLTFEAWVRTTSPANTTAYEGNPALTVIGDNNNAVEGAFGVHDGKVRYTHWTGVATTFDQIDGTVDVNDGEWHHIAVTHKSGSNEVIIYVDGIQDVVATSTTYNASMAANRVGSSYLDGTGNDNFFVGDIDEVRIWDVALPESEIRNFLYNDMLNSSSNFLNLVLHYNFNQGAAGGNNSGETAAIDQTDNALDGGLNGFALTGATSNFISSGNTSFTPSAPVLPASNVTPSNIGELSADVSWTNGDGDRRVVVVHEGTGNAFPAPADGTFGEADQYGLGTDLDGGWFVVYNGYGNSTTIENLSGGTDYEVAVLEINGPPTFDTYNTNTAPDNPVAFSTSVPISNYALDFDGMNDQVQVASPAGFPVGAAPRTMELWFKSNVDLTVDTNHGIAQYGTTLNGQMFGLITSSNAPGKLYFFGNSQDLPGVTDLVQDQWYHAAVTYDGTNVSLYLDGNLEASAPLALNTVMSGEGLTIGRRAGLENFWDGQLDEVRIWDYARTQTEIQNDMNNQLFGNEPGLLAYYPMSDGPGSTSVADLTGGGNGALLVNMDENTDWVAGPSLAPPVVPSFLSEDFQDQTLPAVASSGPFILGTGLWDGVGVLESGDIDARGGTGNGGRIEPAGGNYIQTPPLDQATTFSIWYKGESTGGSYDVLASNDGVNYTVNLGTINPSPTYQEFVVDFTSNFDPTYTGAVRIAYNSGTNALFVDDATADVDALSGTVTLTTETIADATVNTGDTDVMIYKFSATFADADSYMEGLYLTPTGADSLDFELNGFDFYQNKVSDDFGAATLMGTDSWSPGNPIPRNSIGLLYTDFYSPGETVYFYVTADIRATANAVTFNIEEPLLDNFGFGNSEKVNTGLTVGPNITIDASDVTAPTVVSFTPSVNPIVDIDTQLELVVEFDEDMDTGINPTIDFPVEDPSTTLTFSTGIWDDARNFRATYNVTDVNADVPDVDVQVTGAQDLVGNVQNTYDGPDAFGIDTENPIITVDTYGTSITSPQLTGTVDDVNASINISVNGSDYPATNNADGTWTLAQGLITSLADGTYDVAATATDASGNTGSDATTDELIISQTVVTLAAENVTSTGFTARWSEGLDVQTYQVDVSTVADFATFVTGFQSTQINATSVDVTGLDFGTNYYYRVRLVNTSDEVSANSNTTVAKTIVDPETTADSTALRQIYAAVNPQGLNWETDRLRNWTGVNLDANRTRVALVDINGTSATGDMPNTFTGAAVGGLSNMTEMNISNNAITGIIDFSGTAITNLNVSGNSLEFDDLEPVVGITVVDYSNQADLQYNETIGGEAIEVRHTNDYSLSITTGGSSNVYTWYRNDVQISTDADFIINNAIGIILSIDYDNMGTFRTEVTSASVPGLTLNVVAQDVLAIANITMRLTDASDATITGETFDGALLEAFRRAQGYDTLESATNVSGEFVFMDVVLGDYLCGIEPSNLDDYIPTYFGNAFQWEEADVIMLRADATLEIAMTEVPRPLTAADGEGTLDVTIEEDFGDDASRIDARRRASKRKCGLRRKRSGGRTGQDDEFELIAYGETDENGEFQFGFLPQGVYRFFVEYPGIPLDDSAFVEFEVGEAGVSDTDFKLQAFASEDGVEVTIEAVLGVILEYFKDLEIYPNPSRDYLNIRYRHLKSKDVTAQLVDLSGNTKWSEDLRNGFDGQLRIDVTNFEEGVYILRFYDRESPRDNVVSFRVIVRD